VRIRLTKKAQQPKPWYHSFETLGRAMITPGPPTPSQPPYQQPGSGAPQAPQPAPVVTTQATTQPPPVTAPVALVQPVKPTSTAFGTIVNTLANPYQALVEKAQPAIGRAATEAVNYMADKSPQLTMLKEMGLEPADFAPMGFKSKPTVDDVRSPDYQENLKQYQQALSYISPYVGKHKDIKPAEFKAAMLGLAKIQQLGIYKSFQDNTSQAFNEMFVSEDGQFDGDKFVRYTKFLASVNGLWDKLLTDPDPGTWAKVIGFIVQGIMSLRGSPKQTQQQPYPQQQPQILGQSQGYVPSPSNWIGGYRLPRPRNENIAPV